MWYLHIYHHIWKPEKKFRLSSPQIDGALYLVRRFCNEGNEKMQGLIPQHVMDVQEQWRLSYSEKGRDFERTEIIKSTTTGELGVISFIQSKLITKSNSDVSLTTNYDIGKYKAPQTENIHRNWCLSF